MEEEYNLEVTQATIDQIYKQVLAIFALASKFRSEIVRLIKAGFRNPSTIIPYDLMHIPYLIWLT